MASIFISYRRSDAEGEAGRLADDLVRRFGEGTVFMDVDTIKPGRDFRKAINESIRSCSVLLAIIGPDWFGVVDSNGEQRLADKNDYVRLEIASALERDVTVIPVMVRGARMPDAELLPPEMKELAYRNTVELTHARWRTDLQFLNEALQPLLEQNCSEPDTQPSTPSPAPTPAAPLSGSSSFPPAHPSPALTAPVLEDVTRLLARFIGPIARVLVKRASRDCNTRQQLLEKVASEIESPVERASFRAAAAREETPAR